MLRRTGLPTVVLALTLLSVSLGCQQQSQPTLKPTASVERAARRAFAGAPPVIPHKPLGADCETCHTPEGKKVPTIGFAPANPHGERGSLNHCKQCHLFQQTDEAFVENVFVGLTARPKRGDRLFPGAPPTIPHRLSMRENCLACHAGPSARPSIRCTHPERVYCQQCHVREAVFTEPLVSLDAP